MRTNIIYITLNCKRTPRIGVAHTSYFISSLNISTGKTLVFNSGVLFIHLFTSGKLYYSGGLFLNGSIYLTSISL